MHSQAEQVTLSDMESTFNNKSTDTDYRAGWIDGLIEQAGYKPKGKQFICRHGEVFTYRLKSGRIVRVNGYVDRVDLLNDDWFDCPRRGPHAYSNELAFEAEYHRWSATRNVQLPGNYKGTPSLRRAHKAARIAMARDYIAQVRERGWAKVLP